MPQQSSDGGNSSGVKEALTVSAPGKHKSLTELALLKVKQSHEEKEFGHGHIAERLRDEANELIDLPAAPDVGAGGEVVKAQVAGLGFRRSTVVNTLEKGAKRIAEDASIRRTDLLLAPSFNAVALAVDAAESIKAENSLEKMLAHQMAVTHEAALRFMDRALDYDLGNRSLRPGDSVEAARLANTAARLMGVYQSGMATLQRMRSGGNQVVTVQHVSIGQGGQAVIGNVQPGRGLTVEGINEKNG